MQKYLAIRVAHQKEESKRSIARRLHHSQSTVAKVIASETGRPLGCRRRTVALFPKLGAFIGRIDAILKEDETAPKKHRRDRRETLVPLDHAPGERVECDFGEIAADYPDGRRTTDVLIVAWSFSHSAER